MGLREKVFGSRQAKPVDLPAILEPVDPVNYDSVLDWMLGLSDKDYKTMLDVVNIYREANKKAAGVLGVKDQPTTTIKLPKLSDKQIDQDLDALLETDPRDLKAAIVAEKPKTAPKKSQSPSKDKKITVND